MITEATSTARSLLYIPDPKRLHVSHQQEEEEAEAQEVYFLCELWDCCEFALCCQSHDPLTSTVSVLFFLNVSKGEEEAEEGVEEEQVSLWE